jgi:hypothetical protein
MYGKIRRFNWVRGETVGVGKNLSIVAAGSTDMESSYKAITF